MKTIKKTFLTLLTIGILASCSKDEQDNSVQRFNRNITFKVIGNYSGTLKATYSNPNNALGTTPQEELTTLPWQKSYI